MLKYGPDDTHVAWSLMSLAGVERRLNRPDLAITFKNVLGTIINGSAFSLSARAFIKVLTLLLYGSVGGYKNQQCGVEQVKAGIPADVLAAKPIIRAKTFDNWFKARRS